VHVRELLTPLRVTTAAIILAAVVLTFVGITWVMLSPMTLTAEPTEVVIPPGTGASATSRILERAGVIRHWAAFSVYATVTGNAASLQAGRYLLCSCDSVPMLVRTLVHGDALTDDVVLTVPEGMNVWEIDELLQAKGLIVPGSFARIWQESEGVLFPDTYRLDRTVASAADEFGNADVIGTVLRTAFDGKASAYSAEQVIVASMLEKEAKKPEDMALVAGIIARRRELGMPLQIDATVAYGWCLRRWLPMSSAANCDVTQAPLATEIKVDGPYNTYTRAGLPAGPISNPGIAALEAAADPESSDYLYYLSTRDGSEIIYSKTLDEHNRNRAKYLGL
jgi:UPF0755 protein